jgi:predicted peroxiredoxin
VQTQWRSGMGGATGLDYAGVRAYLDESGLAGDERKDIFTGIRAAEGATLQAWAEKAKQDAA